VRKKSDSVLALFFVSGFTGLIYESVWSHYVKLFLGHAAYAQTLVLVVFIGGLALGAWLCARAASRLRNPLRTYAMVEAAIGLIAFAFHGVFAAAVDWGYATLLPATCDPSSAFCASQWLLSAALLAPQSILLGATFPLVSSAALRVDSSEPGHDIAALYFLNSLGAVLGVLASAFVLIPAVGLPGTLRAAGYGNVVIAAIAWWLSRRPSPPLRVPLAVEAHRPRESAEPAIARLLLATAFLTGLSSFIYEIVWIRMLSLVLGASTHSFELMLASFILGLALGGAWIRRRIDASSEPTRLLGRVQIVMGLAALATLPIYNGAFDLMAWMLQSIARNDAGFVLFNAGSTVIALLVMLPATFCAGMTLPLITYRLLRSPRGEQALGLVYAVNTLGSIMGVVIAVHLLLAWLGLRGALVAGALIDVGLGIVLIAWVRRGRRPIGLEAIAALILVGFMALFFDLDMRRLSSGVFRGGSAQLAASQSIIFHRDGKTATVDVLEGLGTRSIRTNGKSDAAIAMSRALPAADEYTMALLAILPLGHKPDARSAAVIGFGSGMSTAVLLASPALQHVDTIEIEPAMVEGAKLFRPVVDPAFADPRSRVVIDDAKSFFARGGQHYDIVVSEPSNPWVSGVASLFTEEFYARMATHLNDGGVLSQWLHTYEMDTTTLASIVAAASKTFGDFVIYGSLDSDVVLIARKGGNPGAFQRKVLEYPQMRPWLKRLGLEDGELVRRRVLGSGVALGPFLQTYEAAPNSDFRPIVDQRASKTRFTRALVQELIQLQAAPVPMLEMFGASPVPSRERHEGPNLIYIEGATAEAWLLRDALSGERRAGAAAPLHERALAAHWIREWTACRTGLAFAQLLPTLVDIGETLNPRLHPEVAGDVWKSLGASACGKSLARGEKRWVELLEAVARRDAAAMVEYALPILDARGQAQGPAWDLALLAGVTGLLCQGEPQRARSLLATGVNGVFRAGTRLAEVRLLDAMTRQPPQRCAGRPF
jgi:predicted membrane-bound spermidine synthase